MNKKYQPFSIKMMPGEKIYTKKQQKQLDKILKSAIDAEKIFDLNELEQYTKELVNK